MPRRKGGGKIRVVQETKVHNDEIGKKGEKGRKITIFFSNESMAHRQTDKQTILIVFCFFKDNENKKQNKRKQRLNDEKHAHNSAYSPSSFKLVRTEKTLENQSKGQECRGEIAVKSQTHRQEEDKFLHKKSEEQSKQRERKGEGEKRTQTRGKSTNKTKNNKKQNKKTYKWLTHARKIKERKELKMNEIKILRR